MLKDRKNVRKIRNIVISLIAILMVLCFYIRVEAIDLTQGTVKPIYRPEWEKVSSTINEAAKTISVELRGTASKSQEINSDVTIDYSSTVTTTLSVDDILVYVDGELDGDTDGDGVLETGETPHITKTLTQPSDTTDIETATHTLTLSGFEEASRQTGKPYKEWHGNISIKILGRGEDESTYDENVLTDKYGNQNMMETDEDQADGTWIDIVYADAVTDHNTNGTMFTDFIKPEFTYESANTTVNNTSETVTIIFDVVDKYFEKTALENLDASQITVLIDDYDSTELNNYLDTNGYKQLTKVQDITYTVNGVADTKIGERYQLVISGLDNENAEGLGDGYKYSGYMTLSFAAGAEDGDGNLTAGVRDKSGNLSAATSITIGKDDVDGNPGQDTTGNGSIVDVVDPIWILGSITPNDATKTVDIKLTAKDKYYSACTIDEDDITVYVNGVASTTVVKDITSTTPTPIRETVNGVANTIVGYEYTLKLSNLEPAGEGYTTFVPTNLTDLDEPTRSTHEYKYREENGGEISLKIAGDTITDQYTNKSNETTFEDVGIHDFTKPEMYEVRKTQDASAKTLTMVFDITDKNYDKTDLIGLDTDNDGDIDDINDELSISVDGIVVDDINIQSLTYKEIITTVDGVPNIVVGHQYTLVLDGFEETDAELITSGREYREFSGTVAIHITEGGAKDAAGNTLNTSTATMSDFVDFVEPDIRYDYVTGDIDYTGKTFTMVFEVTDKYFQNSPFANEVEAVMNDATKTTEQKNAAITTIIQNYLTIEVDGEDITDDPLVTKKITAVENVTVTTTMNKTVDGTVKTLDPANADDADDLIIGKRFTLEISNLQQELVDVGDEYLDYSGVITVSIPAGFGTDTTGNNSPATTITSGVDIPGGTGTGTIVDVVDPIWEIAGTVTASSASQTAVLPVKGTDKYMQTIGLTAADITITVTSPDGVLEIDGTEAADNGMTLSIVEDTTASLAYGKKYIVTLNGFSSDAYQVKITFAQDILVDQSGNKSEETEFILFSSLVETSTETAADSKFLSKNVADTSSLPERQLVEKVIFQDDLDGINETRWDVSQLNDNSIWAWYEDADNDGLYEVYIGSYIIINANVNSSYLFSYIGFDANCGVTGDTTAADATSKQLVENLDLLHTDGVENMSYMFQNFGYSTMKSLDLGDEFDTINVTNMSYMFYKVGYTKMTTLNLGDKFDTRNVTYMNYMFRRCGYLALKELDLGAKFDTSKVTQMNCMFSRCGYSAMTTLNLGDKFDTSNVIDMSYMFEQCGFTKMTSLDLGDKFYTTRARTMEGMFYDCGNTAMTTLDLGPNFTKIASTNTDFATDAGKSEECIIFAPEAIYSSMKSFKLNAAATTGTVSYTNGTINPVYKPEWEKVSSTLTADGVMTIVVKGYANKTFTNGTYTGTYLSDVQSPASGFTVYVDGEAVTDITKNITVGTPTLNESTGATEITATITLSNFPKNTRTTGKNFKDWAGNVSIQFDKGTLRDKFGSYVAADNTTVVNTFTDASGNYIGSQNLAVIDIDTAGTTERIEVEEDALVDTETDNSDLMFIDDVKPEFTYEYTNTTIDNDTETVKIVFDVTDKYFSSTTLSTNTDGSLIDVIVDEDENANTPITKVLAKKTIASDTTVGKITYKANGDIYYTTANGTLQKIGERYELVITGLDQGDGFSYSGPMTLAFPAGVVTDKSGNTSDLMTITIGINETDGDTSTQDGGSAVVVDVVDPIWEIDNVDTNETTQVATMDLIATDKYYENTIITADSILVYIDGALDGDTNNNGVIDAGETPIISKSLSTASALADATKGIKYTLTLGNWLSDEYSGTVKFVIPAATTDADGNLTYGIIDESGNLSNETEFVLGHIDLVKPVIQKADTTTEIETEDAANKTETILINVMDKYLDTTDPLATNELTVYVDGEEVAVDFTNSSSTGLDGVLTKVQDFTATVGGDPDHVIGQQYKLVLSNFEQALRNSKEYKDYSGTVTVKVAGGAVKDIVVTNAATGDSAGGNVNLETTLTADFVDYIKPDIEYTHQASDVDTGNKKYIMTFDVTDKYYTSGVLTTEDIITNEKIEILMQNGQLDANGDPIVYNLKDEPVTIALSSTPIEKTFNKTVSGTVVTGQEHTIGHTYTLTISNLEQFEIKTGLTTADYSGIITVSIDGDMITDTSGNGNPAETITAGVNIEGGVESGTPVEVDVVDPLWNKVSSSAYAFNPADKTKSIATVTIKGTDTYLDVADTTNSYDDSTLTSDEIEVYIDGTKNTSITPTISTVTPLTETRRVYNSATTETVQYGVQYTITLEGWAQNSNQVKIKILEDAIKDETGNGNKATEFIIYNCLESSETETAETSGFLDGNGVGESGATTGIARNEIQQVIFVNSLDDAPITVAADGTITLGTNCWDVSAISDKSILAWTSQTSAPYTVYVGSDFEIFANQNASYLFSYIGFAGDDEDEDGTIEESETYYTATETDTISNIGLLNVSGTKYMNYMFNHAGYTKMTSLDLGTNFDTSNVIEMRDMFYKTGYMAMSTFSLGSMFDTSNVTTMYSMFNGLGYTEMTSLNLGTKFNTSKVTNMSIMFSQCGYEKMQTLDLGDNFDTSNVKYMTGMFLQCGNESMTSLDLSSGMPETNTTQFNTAQVTDMTEMFFECGETAMRTLNLGTNFDTTSVTKMKKMFHYCGREAMGTLDLGDKFKTINVTNMNSMFYRTGYFTMTKLDLGENFDTRNVTDMYRMFYHTGGAVMESLDLGDKFYTTSATTMEGMFYGCGNTAMTTLDLGPAFTKIVSTNTDFIRDTGKSGECVIYAPESIYKSRTSFKLNSTDTTETPDALKHTRGTINPIYRPEWTKTSSALDDATNPTKLVVNLSGASSKNQAITGTNVTIKYSSTVTTALTTDQIEVYIDGELDGDTDGDGVLETGETPHITKELTQPDPATGIAAATHTLTLSGFEEAARQTGKNFLEWSGNISLKILGRGEETSTYTANVLKDVYGNQSMMETDEADGTWIDVTYEEAETDHNDTSSTSTMFTDFVKPEYTYEYSTTNPDINTGAESVTVVFDVTDKYFESTTLSTNTNGSLITVIVDDDENANTPITKVLTRINDVWYDATTGINIVNPDATGTGTKIGERYQLVITGLDREDGFTYSGPLTLSFPAGIVTDKSGNTSALETITMGVNEPGGDADDEIVVDVVDPIWKVENLDTTIDAEGNVSATMDLIGVDKYFKQSTLTNNDIKIKVDGVDDISVDANGDGISDIAPDLRKTLGTAQYIKKDESGNYVVTANAAEAIGVKYQFSISGLKETDNTFFANRADYNANPANGRPYREYSGEMSIIIPADKLEDQTGNKNNEFTLDLDHVDTLKPEVIKVSGTANVNASNSELSTYTVVFDIVDKYINSSSITVADTSMIHVYLDGEEAASMTKPATETEQNANADKIFKEITNIQPLTDTVNGETQTVGYRYTLVLSGIEKPRTTIDYNREYTDWSGDLSIKIDANTATDTSGTGNDETIMYGNEVETTDKTKAAHVDYVKPDATYEYTSTQDGVSDVTDKDGKTYTMVFDITDKFFQTEDVNANGELDEGEDTNSNGVLDDGDGLSIADFTILMSAEEETGEGEDGYYDLMSNALIGKSLEAVDITNEVVVDVVNGAEVKETKVIGKRYTLRLSNLEQLQRIENNYYLDYSGTVTISIPAGKITDTSGNGNDATSITSGIDIPGGEVNDISTIDVVQPLWERTAFTTDIHNQTATITLLGTDKYFYEVDDTSTTDDDSYGILTLDEIELYVDGTKVSVATGDMLLSDVTKLYEERLVQTEYSDGDVDTGYTTETVQYGVQYTVTLNNFDITKNQIKIRLPEGTLVDQSGNPNRLTEFLVYNTLRTATDTEGNWEDAATSGFLSNANIARQDIQKIIFVEDLDDAPTIDTVKCWDVSAQRDNSILAWYNETSAPYTVYIGSNDDIYGNVNSSYLFSYIGYGTNCTSTETIRSLNLLDTRNVTNMSYMFNYCGYRNMTALELGDNFDTSNVTDMNNMFNNCGYSKMSTFSFGSKFDTSNVQNMSSMFQGFAGGSTGFTSLDLGATGVTFNTAKVTDMSNMFNGCGQTSMTTFSLGNSFDTTLVENMSGMFQNFGHNVGTLTLGNSFKTSAVTDMSNMFNGCGQIAMTTLTLGSNFNTTAVQNMSGMFQDFAKSSTTMVSLDLGDLFYTTAATDMSNMFNNCGYTSMTILDLGPAFTKIASTNSGFITGTGKYEACTIYAPESIYNDITHFKLDTNSTTTIEYTRGLINPVYRPEWEKVSTSVDVDNKEITVTFKGYANETFTNGTYTGSYLSTITSSITAGNDTSNLLIVKVDGEVAEEITQTVTEISVTGNEVQYTIKLSGFEETARRSSKNFKEWSGNIAVQPVKGTLIDIYGNKNMIAIDDSTGKWTDIELRDVNQEGSDAANVSGNWTNLEDNNTDAVTNGTMFTDYIKPEFTYEYYNATVDTNANTVIDYTNNKVTVVFDVTDKYFASTTLATDTEGSLITVEVDEDADANTAITKSLTKKTIGAEYTDGNIIYETDGDICYTINGVRQKVGERYELVITNLESSHGVGYSGIVTLSFPAGVITDKSGNTSALKTITIGIDEPANPDHDGNPEGETDHTQGAIVDVVNPIWSYAVSDIDRTNDQVNIYIIGSDKHYKENTLTTDKITVFVDNSSTTVDTDRNGTLDGNVTTITKTLTDITAEMQTTENAARLAELIAGAGLTDSMTADNNLTAVGVIYKLTLSTFGTISGETKVVLDEDTIEDTSGNKNIETTIEVGNVTWEEENEPLESTDDGYPRYPAFRNDIVDFIDPAITYTHSTVEIDTDGDGTPDTEVSENPDIDYEDKIVTVKFTVTDKYLLESDLIETTTDGDGNTIQIPKNITLIIDGTTIYTNDGDDTTTDTREVTTSILSTDITDGTGYVYGKEYTLVVKGLQKYEYPDNEGFTYSGPMQVVFTPGVIEDTSGNTNSAKTITLDTMYDDIVDVVDPIIKYSSSSINRTTGTVTLRLVAEDKYLSSETLRANIDNVIVKIVDLDGNQIVNDNTTIQKSISMTSTVVGGYTRYTYTITLSGFETDETIASKNRETDTLIKGITSIIIPADTIKDTSGNGNVETPILVGSPTDTTAFKDSIVDCVSPIWEYETSSIDRDRYDNGIAHDQTGTVTIDIIGTDKFFDNTYFTDSSKELTIEDIKVFVNNVENTTITKSLNTNADGSLFKEQLTRTLADGTTAPFGVRYRLLLSDFGTNDGAVRIEIANNVIRDTSGNENETTSINAGNTQWVEEDEPLEEGVAGYPKYPAFRTNIVDFINPVVTYTYSNVAGSENPILDTTDDSAEKLYIKFNVTDTNFLESNIEVGDLTIYADINDGNGNSEMNITTLLSDRNAIELSTPTSITNGEGVVIGKSYTITLSQFELTDLLENEVFLRHSGRIRFVVAEGQVEDTSGNKNVETSLIVDYGDGTNTGTDEDDYVIVDFVDPIIKYQSKFINWNERYATVTLRATDRFYDMSTELEPSDLTLYELNENGEWINITSQYYDPDNGINNLTITKTPVTNAEGYQYGYDFTVKLDDFEEEFKLKIAIKAGELGDTSLNTNQLTEIAVDLDNRKPKWEYVSTVTTNFEDSGTITFIVKGVDKFLDVENSNLTVIQAAEGIEASTDVRVLLDGVDITSIPNIRIIHMGDDEDNTDDGERSKTYQIDVSGLTQVGTYSLVFEKDTLVDEFSNKSAATTITFSKSSITGNTGNYTNITYHVSPDNNQVHSSFVHEMMSLNTTGTNFEGTASSTFKPSSIGELNNDGENPLFAEPMYDEELETDGYTVKYVYAPKSFAGWAEADSDGNIITGGTTYGLYDDIPNTVVHLKAVWQDATVVFVSASDGNNSNDGKLPTTPVKDMETAFSKLNASGTVGNNIIVIMDEVTWSSDTTLTKPATITSLYAGIDYRKSANAELKITSNITTNADITFDNIELYTNSTDVSDGSDYLANDTYSNMLIANYADVILGRRVTTPSGYYTFGAIIGGNYETESTTGTIGTHTVRVEAGRYNNIIAGSAFATATTTTKTVTHEVVIGNMREAAISRNDRLTITGYVAMGELTGATNTYAQDYSKVTLYSGVFTGDNAFNKSSEDVAIYMRSLYGTVDGKTQFEMYGGEVNANINAGSGETTAANSAEIVNTMNFYGGTVVGNIFGQGINNAFIGSSDITLTGRIDITGNVFGGSNVTTSGQGNGTGDTNITINSMSATVDGNIYGGSNGVSNSGYLTGDTNITVNAGTLTNIYGSGNNTGNSGDTNITINNGTVSGNIVGGAYKGQAGGTANITVVGGIVSGNIFGGNENTTQTELDNDSIEQDAIIIIGTTDETITTIPTINGIIYAGGVYDAVGTTEVQLIEAQNTISAVYGSSNANAETTEANITLNGATVGVIYGGGNEAGTVEEANINLTSGTVTDVYGGGYAANVTTSNVTLQGTATVESIYGGSNASATATGLVTTSNVILTSGNVTNAFGGGNSSDVGTANITLNGITIDELYGGSKDAGTVTTSNVTLTSGTVGTVFGGGLDSDVGTSNVTHNATAVVTTIYGGNNTSTGDGGTVGTSNINIINTEIANVYGGNYLRGTTTNTNINIQGTATVTGKLFGGGNKSNIATSSVTGSTTINVTGGTINCDINGGSEQGVVYGTTNINIGKDAVATTLTYGNINITGTIYGAGSSDLAVNRGSNSRDSYNYNYVSVVGTTNIVLDASLTTPITFSGSIYGAGNGATYSADTDTSRIFLKDLGSSTAAYQLISVERTGRLFIGNSFIELLGKQDVNNEYQKASYTLNRITDGLTVYNNTTLYTRRGFNKVGGFNSFTTISEVTGNGTKAAVTVTDGAVETRNVDNRLYTFEGVNLIFSKQETFDYATATSDVWGEVNGMTFFGMYALDDSGNKVFDIYDPDTYNSSYTGTLVEKYFANGTFVEGLHETNHVVSTDGFYTVAADYDTDTVEVEIIQPTPESATYYDWLIGADRVTYNVSLIGSIFGDQATAELDLDYNYLPSATYTFDRVSLNALDLGVNLINPLDIDIVSEDANDTFGLTVETDTSGWLNKAKTNIYTQKDATDTTQQDNGSFDGDLIYNSDNSTTPGTIKFKMYNSLNITETKDLGFVNLILTGRTTDPDDPSIGNTFIIVIAVNLQAEATEQIEDYVPKFTDTALTELNYTSDSRVDLTYVLFKDMETTPFETGDYRVISTSTPLPEGTKLTLKDYGQGDNTKVYYYHVTNSTTYTTETVDGTTRYLYKLSDIFEMASTTAKYQDSTSYYHSEGYVLEKYDLSIDFIDSGITTNELAQETYLELRNASGAQKYDNGEKIVKYNLYSTTVDGEGNTVDANAVFTEVLSNEGETYSVIDNTDITFTLDVSIQEQLTAAGDKIRDTKYYDKIAGIAIEVVDANGVRVKLPDAQNVRLVDLDTSVEYPSDESGVIRVPLFEGLSSMTKNYKFSIAQNSVPPGSCSVKVYFFTSDNGEHYGNEEKLEKEFYALFINRLLGLVGVEATSDSRIVSKETGLDMAGNAGIDMTLSIGDATPDTNIRVKLYKRNATYDANGNYTGTEYTLVNISEYLQGTWETPEDYELTTEGQYQYMVWTYPEEEAVAEGDEGTEVEEIVLIDFEKLLQENIDTGEYKVVFESYFDDILVQTVRKTFIVTQ